jgi:hypothetical protein
MPRAKKPKTEKPVDECFTKFVELWISAYPTLGFNPTSGRKIKEMIVTSREIVRERAAAGVKASIELTETQRTIGIFQYILDYVKRTNHWCHRKNITTFESKYREIYTEIVYGKQKPTNSKPNVRDIINAL